MSKYDLLGSVEPVYQLLESSRYQRAGLRVVMARLDLLHAQVSGNKLYKLRYNLVEAGRLGLSPIVSFGGAYSNHIHALAWAGHSLGIKTIGIIRGEPAYANNPTLSDARAWGMELIFVDRVEYKLRHSNSYQERLLERWPGAVVVPEGGSNHLALKGFSSLVDSIQSSHGAAKYWLTAMGTGGTLAGLLSYAPKHVNLLGVAVLKNAGFLYQDVSSFLADTGVEEQAYWGIDLDGHCGGYARTTSELLAYIDSFKAEFAIQLDQVYTGKMMFQLERLIAQNRFEPNSEIIVLHTGGLQGLRGLS